MPEFNSQFSILNFQFRFRKGFSLVEILVVVAIFAVIIFLTTTSFSSFSKNSKLASAASDLKANLRFAQNKALAGDKSTPKCSNAGYILVGWYVTITQNSSTYSLSGICKNSLGIEDPEVTDFKTVTLASGVTVSSNSARILFQPIVRGASVHNISSAPYFYNQSGVVVNSVGMPFSINLSSESGNYQITIMPSGEISEKKL